jgi:hypothetical protein
MQMVTLHVIHSSSGGSLCCSDGVQELSVRSFSNSLPPSVHRRCDRQEKFTPPARRRHGMLTTSEDPGSHRGRGHLGDKPIDVVIRRAPWFLVGLIQRVQHALFNQTLVVCLARRCWQLWRRGGKVWVMGSKDTAHVLKEGPVSHDPGQQIQRRHEGA